MRVHSVWAGMGCAHLIEGEGGAVLVDAGSPEQEGCILRALQTLGCVDLRLIYVTHAHLDHYGSAAALRRETGAPIAIHIADAAPMAQGETPLGSVRGRGWLGRWLLPLAERYLAPEPTEPDVLLQDEDRLDDVGLDATVLHTPGHTPGSSSLLVEGRVAFVGDLISTTGWPHAQGLYAHDWTVLAHSLHKVQHLDLDLVYGGHGRKPVRGETLRKLRPVS